MSMPGNNSDDAAWNLAEAYFAIDRYLARFKWSLTGLPPEKVKFLREIKAQIEQVETIASGILSQSGQADKKPVMLIADEKATATAATQCIETKADAKTETPGQQRLKVTIQNYRDLSRIISFNVTALVDQVKDHQKKYQKEPERIEGYAALLNEIIQCAAGITQRIESPVYQHLFTEFADYENSTYAVAERLGITFQPFFQNLDPLLGVKKKKDQPNGVCGGQNKVNNQMIRRAGRGCLPLFMTRDVYSAQQTKIGSFCHFSENNVTQLFGIVGAISRIITSKNLYALSFRQSGTTHRHVIEIRRIPNSDVIEVCDDNFGYFVSNTAMGLCAFKDWFTYHLASYKSQFNCQSMDFQLLDRGGQPPNAKATIVLRENPQIDYPWLQTFALKNAKKFADDLVDYSVFELLNKVSLFFKYITDPEKLSEMAETWGKAGIESNGIQNKAKLVTKGKIDRVIAKHSKTLPVKQALEVLKTRMDSAHPLFTLAAVTDQWLDEKHTTGPTHREIMQRQDDSLFFQPQTLLDFIYTLVHDCEVFPNRYKLAYKEICTDSDKQIVEDRAQVMQLDLGAVQSHRLA